MTARARVCVCVCVRSLERSRRGLFMAVWFGFFARVEALKCFGVESVVYMIYIYVYLYMCIYI